MENPKASRREFCAHAISFVTVASLIEACGGNGNPTGPSGGGGGNTATMASVNGSAAGNTVTVTVDGASPLAAVGSAALVQSGMDSFLVARTGQDSFSALTAVCTHEGCIINGFSSGRFVCPCHGSQFSTGGQVQNGPANRPLRSFTTQFTNGVLTITV